MSLAKVKFSRIRDCWVVTVEGVERGIVFKYMGSWWVNNAGDMRNRKGTKDAAVAAVLAAAPEGPTERTGG